MMLLHVLHTLETFMSQVNVPEDFSCNTLMMVTADAVPLDLLLTQVDQSTCISFHNMPLLNLLFSQQSQKECNVPEVLTDKISLMTVLPILRNVPHISKDSTMMEPAQEDTSSNGHRMVTADAVMKAMNLVPLVQSTFINLVFNPMLKCMVLIVQLTPTELTS